ncbi:hypothetical protein [Agarivorans sp. QJM3NY_25]|uniref:hypothetical protein n=1 Tax=Agarivorans sp. QJM3NY_25 TaxID=3421430 RepID=UPI003D7F1054
MAGADEFAFLAAYDRRRIERSASWGFNFAVIFTQQLSTQRKYLATTFEQTPPKVSIAQRGTLKCFTSIHRGTALCKRLNLTVKF